MRLTRALARLTDRRVGGGDLQGLHVDASRREGLLEASLSVGSGLIAFATCLLAVVVGPLTDGADGGLVKLLHDSALGLILGALTLVVPHGLRYFFWWPYSSWRRRHEKFRDAPLRPRIPVLMSTDLDFALALLVVVVHVARA